MLKDCDVSAVLAVKDIEVAKKFYEGVLGLSVDRGDEYGMYYKSGNCTLLVYPSPQYAGTNKATAAGWKTDNLEAIVAELKAKGVTFERYEMPGVTLEGDIHIFGDGAGKAVWFKDPDGNILAIDQM